MVQRSKKRTQIFYCDAFQLKCFSLRAHDVDFPHLLLSENATQFDMVMENIRFDAKRFPQGRMAAEVLLTAEEPTLDRQSFDIYKKKSLDDEHTPGIFEVVEIASPESYKAARGKLKFEKKII